jgi:hypothetical protein
MRTTLRLLLASLPLACVSAPPSEEEAGPTVALVYGWKPGLEARVVAQRVRIEQSGERTRERSVQMTYRLSTLADGENLRVRSSDHQFSVGGELAQAAQGAQVLGRLLSRSPDLLVDSEGELVGLHDLGGFRARLLEEIGGLMPSERVPPQLRALVDSLLSEAALLSSATDQWNGMVGAWIDSELEIGADYTYSERSVHPVFPGEQILMNYEFRVTQLEPCRRGAAEVTCAHLEMWAGADPEDSKRIIEKLMRDVVAAVDPNKLAPLFEEISIESFVHVVTEPDGLIPHLYEETEHIAGVIRADGKTESFERTERSEATYQY